MGDDGKLEESGKMLSDSVNDTTKGIVNHSAQVASKRGGSSPSLKGLDLNEDLQPSKGGKLDESDSGKKVKDGKSKGKSTEERSEQIFERIHYREWSNEQESLVRMIHVYFARVKQRTAEIVANKGVARGKGENSPPPKPKKLL